MFGIARLSKPGRYAVLHYYTIQVPFPLLTFLSIFHIAYSDHIDYDIVNCIITKPITLLKLELLYKLVQYVPLYRTSIEISPVVALVAFKI